LPEHLDDFRGSEGEGQQQVLLSRLPGLQRGEHLTRYSVNAFVLPGMLSSVRSSAAR